MQKSLFSFVAYSREGSLWAARKNPQAGFLCSLGTCSGAQPWESEWVRARRQMNQYENAWRCNMCGLALAELQIIRLSVFHSMETGNAGLWHQETSWDHAYVFLVLKRRLDGGGSSEGIISASLTEWITLVHNITGMGRKGASEAAHSPHSTLEIKP